MTRDEYEARQARVTLLDANGKEIREGSTVKHVAPDSVTEGAPMKVIAIAGRSVITDFKRSFPGRTPSGQVSRARSKMVTASPVFLASLCEVVEP